MARLGGGGAGVGSHTGPWTRRCESGLLSGRCDTPTICRQKAAVAPLCTPAFGPPAAAVCGPIKLPMGARRRAAEFCQLGIYGIPASFCFQKHWALEWYCRSILVQEFFLICFSIALYTNLLFYFTQFTHHFSFNLSPVWAIQFQICHKNNRSEISAFRYLSIDSRGS